MVGRRSHPQRAAVGAVHEPQPGVLREVLLGPQRGLGRRGDTRVARETGQLFVGDEFGLHGHRGRSVDRLHLVDHRGHRPLGEGHEPA